ncbi:MAG: hypothetical protein Q9170_002637 [Blastenia crenularia]
MHLSPTPEAGVCAAQMERRREPTMVRDGPTTRWLRFPVYVKRKGLSTMILTHDWFNRAPSVVEYPSGPGPAQSTRDACRSGMGGPRDGEIRSNGYGMVIFLIRRQTYIRFNAYNENNPGRATLALVPKAYVGWHRQFSEKCALRGFQRYSWGDAMGAHLAVSPAKLKEWRAPNAKTIVQRFWEMYFEGEPRSLVKLQDLIDGVSKMERQLAPAKPTI